MGWGTFFTAFGVSLKTFWLFTAIFSLAALIFFFWAVRIFFSESFSIIFLAVMGLGYWPIYCGRFVTPGTLLLFWMGLVFTLLAYFLEKSAEKFLVLIAACLGLVVGSGFYIYFNWPVVAIIVFLALVWDLLRNKPKSVKPLIVFTLAAGLVLAPLAWNFIRCADKTYLVGLSIFHSLPDNNYFKAQLSILSAFFWGPAPSAGFAYKPFWGGFFNPVLGALIFLGLLDLWRLRFHGWLKILPFIGLVLWLPQGLSRGEEYMRMVQLIPFFLVLAVIGARLLFIHAALRKIRFGALALAMMSLSVSLDAYHLFGVYHQWWIPAHDPWFNCKSLERQRAFQIFDHAQSQWGPGLILADLVDDIHDQTLSIASWEFNALENPKAPVPRVPWAGILCNVHYKDYLSRLFPAAQWNWLASDVFREDGGLMAGIIPVTANRLPLLKRWVKAEKSMHVFAGDVFENLLPNKAGILSERLDRLYPQFKGDPFLESCFWEKKAHIAFMNRRCGEMVEPLQKALKLGVPEAHLYNRLGVVYLELGDFEKAGMALKKAMAFRDNHTSAAWLITHYLESRHSLPFP